MISSHDFDRAHRGQEPAGEVAQASSPASSPGVPPGGPVVSGTLPQLAAGTDCATGFLESPSKTRRLPERLREIGMPRASLTDTPTRRQFISGAIAAFAGFMIVPSHVLGRGGAKPPSEKLNVAGIGIGGQGASDLAEMEGENIVALCDVDDAHAARTFKRYPKARAHRDYRKMLEEQKDIDAVVIATPDHQHAIIAMAAMRAGKHVYCEKPLTHTVWEARQLTQAAHAHKIATQMGNQGQASEGTRRLSEMIRDDAIGPVREVHVWTDRPSSGLFNVFWPQGVERPTETSPVPDTLDWDLWLGPAPARPYHSAYLPFKWRGWWDFGTGALGDIGCHTFDPVFRALKLGHPLSVEASSTRVNEETYPLASMVTYHFPARPPMPPVKLVWYDGGLRPPPSGGTRRRRGNGRQRPLVHRGPRENPLDERPGNAQFRPDPRLAGCGLWRSVQKTSALHRPLPGMDPGVQRRPTGRFKL